MRQSLRWQTFEHKLMSESSRPLFQLQMKITKSSQLSQRVHIKSRIFLQRSTTRSQWLHQVVKMHNMWSSNITWSTRTPTTETNRHFQVLVDWATKKVLITEARHHLKVQLQDSWARIKHQPFRKQLETTCGIWACKTHTEPTPEYEKWKTRSSKTWELWLATSVATEATLAHSRLWRVTSSRIRKVH